MSIAEFAKLDLSPRQRFLLRGIDWATYQTISRALDGRHLRLSYDGENLELMTISGIHATLSRLLGRFVVVLTEELELPLRSCGDMTLDRADLQRGLEADESFYIENEPLVRDKDQADLTVEPPPDLGVEIDITSSSRRRMAIYAAIKVPEVWRYDSRTLTVFVLGPDGQYEEAAASRTFPQIRIEQIADFLAQVNQVEENELVKQFRAWVRQQIHEQRP
jgi:Uma2 family endonuclease